MREVSPERERSRKHSNSRHDESRRDDSRIGRKDSERDRRRTPEKVKFKFLTKRKNYAKITFLHGRERRYFSLANFSCHPVMHKGRFLCKQTFHNNMQKNVS